MFRESMKTPDVPYTTLEARRGPGAANVAVFFFLLFVGAFSAFGAGVVYARMDMAGNVLAKAREILQDASVRQQNAIAKEREALQLLDQAERLTRPHQHLERDSNAAEVPSV